MSFYLQREFSFVQVEVGEGKVSFQLSQDYNAHSKFVNRLRSLRTSWLPRTPSRNVGRLPVSLGIFHEKKVMHDLSVGLISVTDVL